MLAYNLGYLLGSLALPATGLVLLIVGLMQRTRPSPPMRPGYPGYPGYPPRPAYPPQGYPPYPSNAPLPAPRPKRRGTGLMVTGAVLLALGLVLGAVRAVGSTSESVSGSERLRSVHDVTVGDCVSADDMGDREPKPADCDDPDAVMEVAFIGGADAKCPDGKRRSDTDYATLFWDDATMCFAANFLEGRCYSVNAVDQSEAPFRHQRCGSAESQIRVVERIDGTTDEQECRSGTDAISYIEPTRVYCLEYA